MDITCDICRKPCPDQGTQGRGRNQRPATSTPTPRPTTPFIPNRHHGLVPHPIYPHSPKPTEAHTSQTNPTGPATSTPASHPPHSCAQNADHLAQNTPYSLNFTEVVCTLGVSIPNTVRSAQIRQTARNPRIRHAARPPTDAPASHPPHSCAQNADHLAQTPHIHPISPKWSALWAHTLQLEARRRRHNGCAYDLHHCGARTLHHRCEQR